MTREEEDLAVRGWLPLLWRVCRRARLPDWLTPEDVLGDAMLGCLEAIRTYDPTRGPLGPRVRTLAAARICDRLRDEDHLARTHRRDIALDKAAEPRLLPLLCDMPGRSCRPGREIEARDEVEHLLARLPEAWARVVRLRYLDGLDLREVGARLGKSGSWAGQVVRMALDRMAGREADWGDRKRRAA